jgi:hypothetical protein
VVHEELFAIIRQGTDFHSTTNHWCHLLRMPYDARVHLTPPADPPPHNLALYTPAPVGVVAADLALELLVEAVQLVQPVGDGLAIPAQRELEWVVDVLILTLTALLSCSLLCSLLLLSLQTRGRVLYTEVGGRVLGGSLPERQVGKTSHQSGSCVQLCPSQASCRLQLGLGACQCWQQGDL